MIFGKNHTDSGADSNGSGKSGLIEGITLAMTGKTCRDVSREEFIHDGEDECYVEMELENSVSNVKNLVIKRWIHRTKSARVEIWKDGELDRQVTSVNEANDCIYQLIGISREDLLHFFIVGQDTNYSFLTAGDAEQKKIISRLTNADLIEGKIENLKQNKKKFDVIVAELGKAVQRFENFIELTDNQIQDEIDNGQKRIDEKIENIEFQIEDEKAKIKRFENSISELQGEIKENEGKVLRLEKKLEDTTEIESIIEENKKKARKEKSEIDEALDLIEQMNRILKGKTTCPKCSHEWKEGEDVDVKKIPGFIEDAKLHIAKKRKMLERYNEAVSQQQEQLKKSEATQREIRNLKQTIESYSLDIRSFEKKIKLAQSNINEQKDRIKELVDDSKNKVVLQGLKNKKDAYQTSLKEENSKLDKALSKAQELDYWIYHFSKKGFMTYLTNQSIKTIETITNSYLKKFNTDLEVKIEGYKVLKNNDVREKITIWIVRNGINSGSFDRYSGGEKGRVNLACIVGLQKLMNMSAKNGGFNFLGLDEVFEGLDTTGQKDVLNILETLGVTTMVVSHRSDAIGAENEICVEKLNGVSTLMKYDKN
jgi:exonuclease SbcC